MVDGADVSELDGTLDTGGRLVGQTRDTAGALVTAMQVVYEEAMGFDHTVRSGFPEVGEFRTLLMAPGTHEVTFHDTRSETERTVEVEIEAGQATAVDVKFADTDLTPIGGPHIDAPRTLFHGAELEASSVWFHPEVDEAWTWYRDGVQISGATGSTYRLTADDAGHAVTSH